jgi:hypothetical protein
MISGVSEVGIPQYRASIVGYRGARGVPIRRANAAVLCQTPHLDSIASHGNHFILERRLPVAYLSREIRRLNIGGDNAKCIGGFGASKVKIRPCERAFEKRRNKFSPPSRRHWEEHIDAFRNLEAHQVVLARGDILPGIHQDVLAAVILKNIGVRIAETTLPWIANPVMIMLAAVSSHYADRKLRAAKLKIKLAGLQIDGIDSHSRLGHQKHVTLVGVDVHSLGNGDVINKSPTHPVIRIRCCIVGTVSLQLI